MNSRDRRKQRRKGRTLFERLRTAYSEKMRLLVVVPIVMMMLMTRRMTMMMITRMIMVMKMVIVACTRGELESVSSLKGKSTRRSVKEEAFLKMFFFLFFGPVGGGGTFPCRLEMFRGRRERGAEGLDGGVVSKWW